MKIRSKLILAVVMLILVHLVSAAIAVRAVTRNARNTDLYTRMRELGQLAADLRTDIYHQLASRAGAPSVRREPEGVGWPQYALEDIEVQIRLSDNSFDREHWQGLRDTIKSMDTLGIEEAARIGTLRRAENHIRSLRNRFSLRESQAIATIAQASYAARVAMAIAGVLTVTLFVAYLLMVWRWLVRPIEALQKSTDILSTGTLEHRVELKGRNELAELGRKLDAMAARLAIHQQQLVEARELSAIGELCTNVAHGLRNPLASLRASAQLAGRKVGDPEETTLSLMEIIQQVDRLDERINQLFDFSKPCTLQTKSVTFGTLSAGVLAEVSGLAGSRDVRIEIDDKTHGEPWVLDDEQVIASMAELATNAIHHSDHNGKITMSGFISRGAVDDVKTLILQVIDYGCGMSPEVLERAFDLFFTCRKNGTGMGLAMVRRCVDRHQGKILIDSKRGVGTKVTMVLPEVGLQQNETRLTGLHRLARTD